MLYFILTLIAAAGAEDLAPRMEVLQQHLDRLEEIQVPADLQKQRDERLQAVRSAMEAPASSEADIVDRYERMDEVRQWLLDHADSQPTVAQGTFSDGGAEWTVTNAALSVSIRKDTLAMKVTTPAGVTWEFASPSGDLAGDGALDLTTAAERSATPFNTGYSRGVVLRLTGYGDDGEAGVLLGVHLDGNELQCTVAPAGKAPAFGTLLWPGPAVLPASSEVETVVPVMQGMILPGDYGEAFLRRDLAHSRTLYMPWWGQVQAGHGVLTILETDDDAGVALKHPAGGPTRIAPIWYSSMGGLRYLRSVRLIFDESQSHVSLAHRYRRYVEEHGRFVTLREKLARTPRLADVIGSPVVHIGALYHYVKESQFYNKDRPEANHQLQTFDQITADLKGLRDKGLEKAYVHLDGWGFNGYDSGHPDVLPPGAEQGGWEGLRRVADACDTMGWVFAVHDQYRDFYLNAASYDPALAKQEADGSKEEHSTWCGGAQTILSPIWSPGYVRRNHDLFAAHGIKVAGAYLDVFSIVPLEESYQEIYPVTRSDCAAYRRQCFDLLRARGYVVSSEEPVDEFVPDLDLVHHAPWFTFDKQRPGIPVPLFSLVYHDSILIPWTFSEGGGWGIRDEDAGRLHCLLNAGLPYVDPGASSEHLALVKEAATLAKRLAHEVMTNHEFVGGNLRRQQATYSDGTKILVDFEAKTYEIQAGTAPAR